MTYDDLIDLITSEVKGLANYLTSEDYENAVADAQRETGWSTPVGDAFRIYWLKLRAKRHLFFYLCTESAHKFKFEQINLQHRFEHYMQLIATLDEQYENAKNEHPAEFTDAVDLINAFGLKIDAGFSYDSAGRDTTYLPTNKVNYSPDA